MVFNWLCDCKIIKPISHGFGWWRSACQSWGSGRCWQIRPEGTAHGQAPPVIEIIRLVAEQVEKLALRHGDDKIEGGIGIAHNEEQRRFPVAHRVKLQFVLRHNVPQLLDIEGRQAGAAAHQNAFECLAGRHFEFDILLDGEVLPAAPAPARQRGYPRGFYRSRHPLWLRRR